ncbi:hypothetical protein AGDE_07298 [Angomonas deanei]|nr:hypothetical protein AGDE_07298 [Angomonas deanei]|eukprot:EPY35486.1 hypothetical protein AGDE_07298 [Angomonas deanei]
MKPRLRLFDAATNAPIDLKDKHPTQEEMEAIVAASGAQEEPSPAAVSAAPIDFMLSDQPVPVRVCHSERGGLPRGLTLLRVESAFAISNWLKPKAGPVSTVRTGPDLSQGEIIHSHVDPTTGLEMGMVMMPDEHMGQGGEAPASVSCVCCGKEGSGGYAANYSFCQTCEAAAFCSPECRDKYRTRHDKYECPLLVKLREVMTLVRREKNAASKPKHKGANPRVEEIEDEAEAVLEEVKTDSDVLPGSGWTNSHLQRRTLPLTFAVYGGIMNKAPGWEKLLRVVERGVHHQVRCWVPEQTQRVLELMAPELPSFNKLPTKGKTEAADFLTTLFMLTRLYGVPRTDSDTCAFFVERTYFRHSCEPNCSWSDALRSYTTTRYVYKGEELRQAIDPDFPQHWPLQIRRKWLARHHGFLCKCDRCIREETRLNHARGDLSNDVTEQLLTADALKREGKAARHPTHHFHSAMHKLIPTALLESPKSDAARQEMKELAAEMPSYLLHSHYLYEDLRHTLLQIALQENEPETAIKEGRASLLFLEALWPGSIPAKLARMQDLPMVFDTRRRRVQNRQLRRRQDINDHKSNTENGEQGEQQASSENTPTRPSSASTSTKRATRLRPQYARDFSEGTVVDQHIGSYHAWYCM